MNASRVTCCNFITHSNRVISSWFLWVSIIEYVVHIIDAYDIHAFHKPSMHLILEREPEEMQKSYPRLQTLFGE